MLDLGPAPEHHGTGSDVDALSKTIDHLASKPEPSKLLVLNGDIVDSLDFPEATYIDEMLAPTRLETCILENQPFWDAVRNFAKHGTVVMALGNHDVELALPECRALLRRTIGGSHVLAFDGAGYRCEVGGKTLFFVHGNNEDRRRASSCRPLTLFTNESRRAELRQRWPSSARTGLRSSRLARRCGWRSERRGQPETSTSCVRSVNSTWPPKPCFALAVSCR